MFDETADNAWSPADDEAGDAAGETMTDTDAGEMPEDEGEAPEAEADEAPAIRQEPEEITRTQAFARRLREERQKERDTAFREAFSGRLNPYTGRPIQTERDYREYQAMYSEDARRIQAGEQNRQQRGEPEQSFTREMELAVSSHPLFQQASAWMQHNQLEQGRSLMQEQMRSISALDPEVKGLEDIVRMPTFPEFDRLVRQQGCNMVDAFKLANFDTLSGRRVSAARQAALNSVYGKGHMAATSANAAGPGIQVPPDIYETYKMINPTATDADIRAHYARVMKG